MLTFTVEKPLDVPLNKGEINDDELGEFWDKNRALGEEVGCYIFAVPRKRGPVGMVPIYVGKSAGAFRRECFNSEKLVKLGKYLRHHPAENLTLFLVVHPATRGKVNRKAIRELERHLIRLAYIANPKLINKQNAHEDRWTIRGVLSDGKGKRSQSAAQLRAVLGFDDEDEPAGAPAAPEPATAQRPEIGVDNRPTVSPVGQQPAAA